MVSHPQHPMGDNTKQDGHLKQTNKNIIGKQKLNCLNNHLFACSGFNNFSVISLYLVATGGSMLPFIVLPN